MKFEITGAGVSGFDAEAGGHRIQRIPPTERRGRVHSSTVTVAVFDGQVKCDLAPYQRRSEDDFVIQWYSGSGAGGQNRNKVMACCRLFHSPTGIVKTAQTRSRDNSYRLAMAAMVTELDKIAGNYMHGSMNADRRDQVGTGERSDRRRTWAFQRDMADDHLTGKQVRCSDALKGKIDRLWTS